MEEFLIVTVITFFLLFKVLDAMAKNAQKKEADVTASELVKFLKNPISSEKTWSEILAIYRKILFTNQAKNMERVKIFVEYVGWFFTNDLIVGEFETQKSDFSPFGEVHKYFLDSLEILSIKRLNEYLNQIGFSDYNIVDIRRSTIEGILPGSYIYKFDDKDNLHLLKLPIDFFQIDSTTFKIFNKNKITDSFMIKYDFIRDFQVHGTQLMNISSSTEFKKPSMGTIFSEALFGTSYTLLSGLRNMQFNITSDIMDARSVQVMFIDKTDMELVGISIYYDFNRIMGNTKNKNLAFNDTQKAVDDKSDLRVDNNIIDKIEKAKTLLELGVITETEFAEIKMRIISS